MLICLKKPVMYNLEEELLAIYDNLITTDTYLLSKRQVGALNGLLTMGLEDKSREMRIAVLQMLAGSAMRFIEGDNFVIKSGKNLTGGVATFLIEQIKQPQSRPWKLSRFGQDLISACENEIKESIKS